MTSKTCVQRLLGAAILLPIVMVVVSAFGQLLRALGDVSGAAVLLRSVQGFGIAWVLTLIGLLLTVSLRQLRQDGAQGAADEEIESR